MQRRLAAAWLRDEEAHRRANSEGRNYWDLYIAELCAQMGLSADVIGRDQLATPGTLSRYSCLLLGALEDRPPSMPERQALGDWLEQGGLLIGFNTRGLDGLFGIAPADLPPVPDNPFAQSACVVLGEHRLCQGIRPALHPEQPLLAFGELRPAKVVDAEVVARLVGLDRQCDLGAAVTCRQAGRGWAVYFGFALPHTLWALHQGRPVDRDWDGDGYFRTGDIFVIGDNEIEVPYADHLVWLVENVVALSRLPLIYALPPANDRAATALFYWAGDDEFAAGDQVRASDFMRSLGLPYHINIMYKQGDFSLSPQEGEHIRANGHDYSLHYNFVPSDGFPSAFEFSAADVSQQADAFYERFGVRAYATVNHWLRWTGYAEPARWMSQVGGKGDGSFVHARMPPLDPCDIFGFPFGTSFPFRFYDDWRQGNELLQFVEKPLTGYEMGYSSEATEYTQLHRLLDLTQRQHLMTSLFYHSNRIANIPNCRAAICEVLRYIEEKGLVAKHLSLNGVVRWWLDRLASSVGNVREGEGGLSLDVVCEHADGLVLRLPVEGGEGAHVRCDGKQCLHEVWQERGRSWLMVVVPQGEHRVEVIGAS